MGQIQSAFRSKLSEQSVSASETCEADDVSYEEIYVPPEILVKAFSYLDVRSRGRAAQVCRCWREIAYVPTLWRDVEVSRLSPASLIGYYLCRGIRRIESPAEPFDWEKWAGQVSAFMSHHRNMHESSDGVEISLDLMCEHVYQKSNKALVNLLTSTSSSLRSLTVRYSGEESCRSILAVVTEKCTNLVRFCLVDCLESESFDAVEFWNALRALKRLRCLVLKYLYRIGDEFFRSLVADDDDDDGAASQRDGLDAATKARSADSAVRLPIAKLYLSHVHGITNEALRYIGLALPELVELNVLHCTRITHVGLTHLSASEKLRRLTLCSSYPLTSDSGRRRTSRGMLMMQEDQSGERCRDLMAELLAMSRFFRRLDSLIVVSKSNRSVEVMAQFSQAYIR